MVKLVNKIMLWILAGLLFAMWLLFSGRMNGIFDFIIDLERNLP